MENKNSKRSINTVIYLLLAAMLACVVFVSIYTVASKRKSGNDTPEQTTAQSGYEEKPNDSDPSTDTSKSTDKSNKQGNTNKDEKAETSPDTAKPEEKPEDTKKNPVGNTKNNTSISVGGLPANEDDELPSSTDTRYFVLPVNGTPSKDFEIDIPVWSMTMDDYRAHTGVDIAAPIGEKVVSASSGVVCRVWNDPMMGYSVTVDHGDNIYTSYMNLSPEFEAPAVGTKIALGQVIGSVGESALVEIAEEPHLHLEMKIAGSYVDPLEYISESEVYTDYSE